MGGSGSIASTLTHLAMDSGAKKAIRGTSSTSLVSTAIFLVWQSGALRKGERGKKESVKS